MSDDGVLAAGIVLLGYPVGLPTFVHSFMHEKNAGMERLGALVQELGVPQLSYHILRVCMAVQRLIHTARATPPELLDDLIGDFDTTLRRLFSCSICDHTECRTQQVFLPFAVEGGGFMDLRCTLRAAYAASLLDTAESRCMLPGSPATASLIEPALPDYATYLQSFGLADMPDLQPATLLTSLGKTQSTISRAVNKVRGERFWPSPIAAGSRGQYADVLQRLAHQASLRQTGSKEWLTRLPSACMQANAHLFPTQLKRYLQDPVYADGTMYSYCHLELDASGHHALAPCTHQLSRLHRHNTLTQVIRRWVFMIVRLYPNYETRALVPHCTDRPTGLLVLIRGLDSDQRDMARHAIDVTVSDPIGSSDLTDVRNTLSSPSAGPAIGEARKRVLLRPR
jgi:hypothetical protein